MSVFRRRGLVAALLALLAAAPLLAETGHDGWLRYAPLETPARTRYASLPATVVVLGASPVLANGQNELVQGIRGMLDRTLRESRTMPNESAIVLGTIASLHETAPDVRLPENVRDDGFVIALRKIRGFDCLLVIGGSERGALYGAFALLRRIARMQALPGPDIVQQPYNSIRWIDQWDNLNGTIERGYAGSSIFFENSRVRADLTRVREYGRLLASVGIDGCNINNVNADLHVLDDDFVDQVVRIADVFRPWGIHVSLSVDLSTPKEAGGLDTFDPLDPRVGAWWRDKVERIYARIPDFGGFTVKADSEGRLGPSTYGRTPADAANTIARALKPHGGIVFYRAFVYNHHLDWNDLKADRAKAAVENFAPLDGKFDDNVVIQIKHGPIDFQVREPASPLFANLRNTNQAIELQITQEYLGQQRHVVYIPPMWKETLDFDMRVDGKRVPVRDIVAGRTFQRPTGGFVGVANVGMDENWLHHPLAMSNLYGFARLAWDPTLNASDIAREWTQLTFGLDPLVNRTVPAMLMSSWPTYENYTGVLGLQTLTAITGSHYGPGIETAERNGWGQWIRADHDGIGMDRSAATGTGFAGQYPPGVATMYESVATTPENLLLFFHHLPYAYRLRSGKTVAQHIYDSHYQGAARAAEYVDEWKTLHGHIDDDRYQLVLSLLQYQAGHAIVWRDAVCTWLLKMSGIADRQGRVGRHPDRVEAEAMQLEGYTAVEIEPAENASGGKGVDCKTDRCSATFKFDRNPGWYELDVQYFDMPAGEARYLLSVNGQVIEAWTAAERLPARHLGGDSSTRRWVRGVALRSGDEIRIEGIPNQDDPAALDYVELTPEKNAPQAVEHPSQRAVGGKKMP
jgi:alpha-glucuronidase